MKPKPSLTLEQEESSWIKTLPSVTDSLAQTSCPLFQSFNVDGIPNQQGLIIQCVCKDLTIARITKCTQLLLTLLGNEDIILGLLWLCQVNTEVDWKKGLITLESKMTSTNPVPKPKTIVEVIPDANSRPLGSIPLSKLSVSDEDNLSSHLDKILPEDLVVSYIQGELVLGIFKQEEPPVLQVL